ncbi:B12-binding domain-containing radical SAM protein [Methylomonas methanica]|uniref:Radical SAM domain protein n=1 Tax=Methylomonas methanica (strain DSM 25384 / MC09) TaxID=857087 RepID=G0A539_METMM|nr:radical SAM protein [Methylomonas methanica]AEG00369.1 Radical SAM domain protein [Methylomonas methanica MC09]
MYDIFCISAGQFQSKKKNSVFSNKHRYLNYGLLGIASTLGRSGYNPIVIHGLFDPPSTILNICEQYGISGTRNPILLSIPSFFALEWARTLSALIKEYYPNKTIIVGGRWVIGNQDQWIKSYLGVDLVIPGLVGANILDIVTSMNKFSTMASATKFRSNNSTTIEYRHLHEKDLFQPSIEVSTGCGMGCSFCEEKDIKLSKLKPATIVAEEMLAINKSSAFVEATPYLESSMFIATREWAEQLYAERQKRGISCNWRVETRVDKLNARNIPTLAKAGLKVVDLGLESASLKQLERMNKTNNPKSYLTTASELIQTAYDNGIWVKVNVLLYAGETSALIDETVDWLSSIRKAIKGVSAGPVIVYGLPSDREVFIKELEGLGATAIDTDVIGVTNISPSSTIDYEASIEISKNICREFMDSRDYYDLKSFSYFSRDYTYQEFQRDIEGLVQKDVSFKL